MATIADITLFSNATSATHGYTYLAYTKTVQGQVANVVRLEKQLNPIGKSASGWFGGYGEAALLTTAQIKACASLNAARRHRYAGSPGLPSGSTVVADLHGDTPVVSSRNECGLRPCAVRPRPWRGQCRAVPHAPGEAGRGSAWRSGRPDQGDRIWRDPGRGRHRVCQCGELRALQPLRRRHVRPVHVAPRPRARRGRKCDGRGHGGHRPDAAHEGQHLIVRSVL